MKVGSKLFGSMFLALCASIGCADLVHAQAWMPVTWQGTVSMVTTGSVTYTEYTWWLAGYMGEYVVSAGPVTRNGNNFSYNFDLAEHTAGPFPQFIVQMNTPAALGTLAPSDYTLTTTSWGVPVATNTFTVPTNSTPMLQPISFDTNGSFNIQLTGIPNVRYILQCSTNLVDWTSLSTNSVGPPLRDTSPVLPGPHFYRVQIVNLTISAPETLPEAILVGEWLAGATNLTDVSGYSPAGMHDGYAVGGGNYVFTNDVPPGKTGQSLFFYGHTAIAISNSSTLDANYTNTFDDSIHSAMTVAFWAKGFPGQWNPWVSKYGENSLGWQMRIYDNGPNACWTIRGTGGADDMISSVGSNDGKWHYYVGTYDSQTGFRKLVVDGVLVAGESGNGSYNLAPAEHLVIGGRDNSPGNSFGYYYWGLIYDVRIYSTALY